MDSTGPPSNEKGSQEVRSEEPRRRRHMDGVRYFSSQIRRMIIKECTVFCLSTCSIITCLACDWSPSDVHSPGHMRDEVSSHVRLHIREESSKLPSRADSFFGVSRNQLLLPINNCGYHILSIVIIETKRFFCRTHLFFLDWESTS